MPKKLKFDHGLHNAVYLAMSMLYVLSCLGYDKSAVAAGLAIGHYLLCRD